MPGDDIESLFYVLLWITVLYDGPGHEQEEFDFGNSILANWTESAINTNLNSAHFAKLALITGEFNFADHVMPYFRVLVPLLTEWREYFRNAIFHRRNVEFEESLKILDNHLQNLPLDDKEYTKRMGTETLRRSLPHPDSQVVLRPELTAKKRQRNIRSVGDRPSQDCKRARGGAV